MNTDRKVLGKGLGALIGGSAVRYRNNSSVPGAGMRTLSLTRVIPNPNQPRSAFRMDALLELTDSIKNKGIIQPLIVRKLSNSNEYQIIAGERRYRAAKLAGLSDVPVVIRDADDDELLETALIENIQRENLNPLEEAAAYQTLISTVGYTQEELARRLGKSRVAITNALRLLKLPDAIKENIIGGELSAGHARALLSVHNADRMITVRNEVLEKNLSVRDTEKIVKAIEAESTENRLPPSSRNPDDDKKKLEKIELRYMADDLSGALSTKITLSGNAKTGKITLHYNGVDELNRLYELLKTIKT